jgi:hypothetical protein
MYLTSNSIAFSMDREYATEDIKVPPSIKKTLDNLKVHPKQPYWEVIKRLIDFMDQQPLTSFDKTKGKY